MAAELRANNIQRWMLEFNMKGVNVVCLELECVRILQTSLHIGIILLCAIY
jgi:hypothetical protein